MVEKVGHDTTVAPPGAADAERAARKELSEETLRQAVHADYIAGELTVAELLQRHGVKAGQFEQWRRDEGWPMRHHRAAATVTRKLALRLFRLLERQITMMEIAMNEPDDKQVGLLTSVVRNLEKLTDIERAEVAKTPQRPQNKDMARMPVNLAKRIDQLLGE